jgi:hypothetical protein
VNTLFILLKNGEWHTGGDDAASRRAMIDDTCEYAATAAVVNDGCEYLAVTTLKGTQADEDRHHRYLVEYAQANLFQG